MRGTNARKSLLLVHFLRSRSWRTGKLTELRARVSFVAMVSIIYRPLYMYPINHYCVTLSPAPPLTVDRVYEAVKGVKSWRGFGGELGLLLSQLDAIQSQYGSDVLRLKAAVEKFLRGESPFYPHPSWRTVIQALDRMNEIQLADKIIDYGEPVQGK
jgi:hypothetical protein